MAPSRRSIARRMGTAESRGIESLMSEAISARVCAPRGYVPRNFATLLKKNRVTKAPGLKPRRDGQSVTSRDVAIAKEEMEVLAKERVSPGSGVVVDPPYAATSGSITETNKNASINPSQANKGQTEIATVQGGRTLSKPDSRALLSREAASRNR
jgi:hypothetical protein